jgi:hypothetical protein
MTMGGVCGTVSERVEVCMNGVRWVSGRGIARCMTMTMGGVCGTVSERVEVCMYGVSG